MKDCLTCGHQHAWGIIRYDEGNVPLYGARRAGDCENFVEKTEDTQALATMTQEDIKNLWAKTEFLNPQVPVATRIAINQIQTLGKGKTGTELIAAQWPEFMGLVVSQLGDVRGALVRDESKFAHLVAHTDEVVEAMRNVTQLAEKLDVIAQRLARLEPRSTWRGWFENIIRPFRRKDYDTTAEPVRPET